MPNLSIFVEESFPPCCLRLLSHHIYHWDQNPHLQKSLLIATLLLCHEIPPTRVPLPTRASASTPLLFQKLHASSAQH